MTRVWGLDLLRATAVIGVLLSHLTYHTQSVYLQKLFPIGPILGVELFFVLSGFLIGQILIKEVLSNDFTAKHALRFMKRRWYRTLPNYYLFLVIMLMLTWNVGKHHIFEFMFFLQNLFEKPVQGFYGVTWSLTIEEIFYITFPLTLVALIKLFNNKNTSLLSAIALFILVPLIIRMTVYDTGEFSQGDFRKAVVIRLDAIGYGVMMAYIKLCHSVLWQKLQKQGMFLLIPFWYIFLYKPAPNIPLNDWQHLYFPLCSLTMALTLPFFDSLKNNNSIFTKPISFIALISYSLYLCHIPVIMVSNRQLEIKSLLNGQWLELYYISMSIIVAYLIHIMWEKPMTNLRDKKIKKPRFLNINKQRKLL